MRSHRWVLSAVLGILALVGGARIAAAQTYVWTDERGVVHAAADPGEVPPQYREKSVRDAARARPSVTVLPDEGGAPPAAPQAEPENAAPRHAKHAPAAAPDDSSANPPEESEPKKTKGLGPPDPGFEWHCATDPEGGPQKCEQFEKKSHRRAREGAAREKARKDLGVAPTDEFDPDVAKKVNERAAEELKKTTPTPTAKPRAKPAEDEGDAEEDQD